MAEVSVYPLKVTYCGTCGFPPDLCAFSGKACAKAAKEAEKAAAEGGDAAVAAVTAGVAEASISGEAAAGAGVAAAGAGAAAPAAEDKPKGPKKGGKKEKPANAVVISTESKGRRTVTIISGLEAFDIKLKDAASALGKKFGSGGTVGKNASGVSHVAIQGDFSDELTTLLEELYSIPEEAIVVKD
jgi:density-regulated protein